MATLVVREGTQMPSRRPFDLYETPREVVEMAARLVEWDVERQWRGDLFAKPIDQVIDLGAGTGVWGGVAAERWKDCELWGVEVRKLPTPPAFTHWITGSFPKVKPQLPQRCSLVWGNPPYHDVESWVRNGLDLLEFGGRLVFLLPLFYLAGKRRAAGLYHRFPPKRVLVYGRISFSGDRRTNATDFGIFLWQKGLQLSPTLHWPPQLERWRTEPCSDQEG